MLKVGLKVTLSLVERLEETIKKEMTKTGSTLESIGRNQFETARGTKIS